MSKLDSWLFSDEFRNEFIALFSLEYEFQNEILFLCELFATF